jgi:pre-mRNA-processing factor 40
LLIGSKERKKRLAKATSTTRELRRRDTEHMAEASSQQALATASNSSGSGDSVWAEYTTPEGRKYYFNKETKETTWDKPEDFKTPEERAIAACPWKEYITDGRKYYHNIITKQSEWEMPLEYKRE